MSKIKKQLPNFLSILRIFFSPFLFFFILIEYEFLAIIIFLYCIISDGIDGYLARNFNACSSLGGYLDVIADFSFVFLALISFIMKNIYPLWILVLITIMFIQFLLTSNIENPVYDPLGKQYGTFLMLMVGITLVDHEGYIITFIPMTLLVYTLSALISRTMALKISKSNN